MHAHVNRKVIQIVFLALLLGSALLTFTGCGTLEVGIEHLDTPEPMTAPTNTGSESPADTTLSNDPPTLVTPSTEGSVADVLQSALTTIPDSESLEIAISWAGELKGECQAMSITFGGQGAIGACKQSYREFIDLDEDTYPLATLWTQWLLRFAPFHNSAPSGNISVQGVGQEIASPAWQRAAAIWGELVWVEFETEGRSESWTIALSWEQEMVDQPDTCQYLEVSKFGQAKTSTAPCGNDGIQTWTEAWLETDEWEQFDEWFYSKSAVSADGLFFYGNGLLEWNSEESLKLHRWAAAVFNRLLLEDLLETSAQPEQVPILSTVPVDDGSSQTDILFEDSELGISLEIPETWQMDVAPGAATHFYTIVEPDMQQPVLTLSFLNPESTSLALAFEEVSQGSWGTYIENSQVVQLGEFEALRLELTPGGDYPPVIWLLLPPTNRAIGIFPEIDSPAVESVLATLRPAEPTR